MDTLKKLDLNGVNFQFTSLGEEKITSKLGGLITIAIIIILIYFFTVNLNTMFQRTNMNIISYQTNTNSEKTIVTSENMFFAIQFLDYNRNQINPNLIKKYFTINATYVDFTENSSKYIENTYSIPIIDCPDKTQSSLLFKDVTSSCLSLDSYIFKGNDFNFMNFSMIQISLYFNFNQYNTTKVLNSIFPINLLMNLPFDDINLNNYTDPIKKKSGYLFFQLQTQYSYNATIKLNKIKIISDSSFVSNDQNINQTLVKGESSILAIDNPQGNLPVLNLLVYPSPLTTLYIRSYFNFQGVINNINSILTITIAFSAVVMKIYNSAFLTQILVNSLFFEVKKSENYAKSTSFENNQKISSDSNNNGEFKIKINEKAESVGVTSKIKNPDKIKFRYTFEKYENYKISELILKFFPCYLKKENLNKLILSDQASNIIKEMSDIEYYFKKINILDYVIEYLFNPFHIQLLKKCGILISKFDKNPKTFEKRKLINYLKMKMRENDTDEIVIDYFKDRINHKKINEKDMFVLERVPENFRKRIFD